MTENVVLRNSDKKILQEEKGESDYADYATRRSQIRSRVRKRSEALVQELELLDSAGETAVAEYLLDTIIKHTDSVLHSEVEARLDRIDSELQQIEQRCSEVDRLKSDLDEIREQLADESQDD